jgi:hypothetical protein
MKLGRLEAVDPREIWKCEAGDFTPWLAQEENLGLLGDTIGIELELEAQEKDVGPFRADILCKDAATGHWVLIENQLEKTDHTHLGQLLTYAAGLKAVTIIWLSVKFTDEHRAALDWLNEVTDESINFFGLEVQLWRIGDSLTAPKFNVVSQPNEWSKRVRGGSAEGEVTESRRFYVDYWTQLRKHIRERSNLLKPINPQAQHWYGFAIGRSGYSLGAVVGKRGKWIQVAIGLSGPHAKRNYQLLENDKDAIERALGFALEWREMPGKKESQISIRRVDVDPLNKDAWQEQDQWFLENLEKFHTVFGPRIKSLDATASFSESASP